MILGSFDHVRRDPVGCSSWLTSGGVVAGTKVEVALHDAALTIFDVRFAPPGAELPGYPAEHMRVTVTAGREVFAVPVKGERRQWLHRYPHLDAAEIARWPRGQHIAWEQLLGPLCLWYPGDPAHLRWSWRDGLDAFFRIVQRHLWFEEHWRRWGTWPVEDAPHGWSDDGLPHPILTSELKSA